MAGLQSITAAPDSTRQRAVAEPRRRREKKGAGFSALHIHANFFIFRSDFGPLRFAGGLQALSSLPGTSMPPLPHQYLRGNLPGQATFTGPMPTDLTLQFASSRPPLRADGGGAEAQRRMGIFHRHLSRLNSRRGKLLGRTSISAVWRSGTCTMADFHSPRTDAGGRADAQTVK